MQVEGTIRNISESAVHALFMEIVPPGQVQNIWNLNTVEHGRLYDLMSYWRAKGGMRPGEVLTWGGIFTSGNLTFVFSPPF